MPELPEVETVRRVLAERLIGLAIQSIEAPYEKIIDSFQQIKPLLIDQTFQAVDRIGKYLIFELDDYYLVSHLRMEGKYFYQKQHVPYEIKHTHAIFTLSNGYQLRYHDTRKFGRIKLYPKCELRTQKPFDQLAMEPWLIDVNKLYQQFKRKNIVLKQALLDQRLILGLGNIYANEVCFDTGLSPLTKVNRLSKKDVQAIVESSQRILTRAIEMGGTTIRSYTSSLGIDGRFQQELKVHAQQGHPCPRCQSEIIKQQIHGRGTYYCPNCQKRK